MVMFFNNHKMRLAYLDKAVEMLQFDEAALLLTDVAVNQDKMLISLLTGR
jgi:hypothetical protein